jgi:hypothetical protein
MRAGPMGSDASFGNNGVFFVDGPCGRELKVIVSDGLDDGANGGWEHVSVSLQKRPPNWQEMCFIKDMFWGEDETVVQYHPPKSDYVNQHPHCLHLWRLLKAEVPRPPAILVGVKDVAAPTDEERESLRRWGTPA